MNKDLTKRDAALFVLEEVLLTAKNAAECINLTQEHPIQASFSSGKLMAYYDILQVALEQAKLVDLNPAEFGLDDFDPESLLKL